jgi:hypothetical protein
MQAHMDKARAEHNMKIEEIYKKTTTQNKGNKKRLVQVNQYHRLYA